MLCRPAKSDIVITTANIPGRTAPITPGRERFIAGVAHPGSIIVDMADGGNCALCVPGRICDDCQQLADDHRLR